MKYPPGGKAYRFDKDGGFQLLPEGANVTLWICPRFDQPETFKIERVDYIASCSKCTAEICVCNSDTAPETAKKVCRACFEEMIRDDKDF